MKNIQAAPNQSINATVKISICGNGVAEGGEECDGQDMRNQTCQSLGYTLGTLTCDMACDYNVSDCVLLSPTPTTSVSPSSTPISLFVSPIPTVSPSPSENPLLKLFPNFFSHYLHLDVNGNGKIDSAELPQLLAVWVKSWRNSLLNVSSSSENQFIKNCDINNDHVCDVKDLSVLLYYVGQ